MPIQQTKSTPVHSRVAAVVSHVSIAGWFSSDTAWRTHEHSRSPSFNTGPHTFIYSKNIQLLGLYITRNGNKNRCDDKEVGTSTEVFCCCVTLLPNLSRHSFDLVAVCRQEIMNKTVDDGRMGISKYVAIHSSSPRMVLVTSKLSTQSDKKDSTAISIPNPHSAWAGWGSKPVETWGPTTVQIRRVLSHNKRPNCADPKILLECSSIHQQSYFCIYFLWFCGCSVGARSTKLK